MKATSTGVIASDGSKHVTTVVCSNEATAVEPTLTSGTTDPSSMGIDWLALARESMTARKNDGSVVVKYGHYNKAFPFVLVKAGAQWYRCVRWQDVDDEYALSFVFQGDPHVHVRCFPWGTDSTSDPEETPIMPTAVGNKYTDKDTDERDVSKDEMFFFLVGDGKAGEPGGDGGFSASFEIEIEEDEEVGIAGVSEGGCGINFATAEELALSGVTQGIVGGGISLSGATQRSEGCSCLYGNPCIDQYVCLNWSNRFDVAKKNGWKG